MRRKRAMEYNGARDRCSDESVAAAYAATYEAASLKLDAKESLPMLATATQQQRTERQAEAAGAAACAAVRRQRAAEYNGATNRRGEESLMRQQRTEQQAEAAAAAAYAAVYEDMRQILFYKDVRLKLEAKARTAGEQSSAK